MLPENSNQGDQLSQPIQDKNLEGPEQQKPNQPLNKSEEPVTNAGHYRDTQRISGRANEASDPNDTNTGGIILGGAKGASQS